MPGPSCQSWPTPLPPQGRSGWVRRTCFNGWEKLHRKPMGFTIKFNGFSGWNVPIIQFYEFSLNLLDWYMEVSENLCAPKSEKKILGFSMVNHPFWGSLIYGNHPVGLPKGLWIGSASSHIGVICFIGQNMYRKMDFRSKSLFGLATTEIRIFFQKN